MRFRYLAVVTALLLLLGAASTATAATTTFDDFEDGDAYDWVGRGEMRVVTDPVDPEGGSYVGHPYWGGGSCYGPWKGIPPATPDEVSFRLLVEAPSAHSNGMAIRLVGEGIESDGGVLAQISYHEGHLRYQTDGSPWRIPFMDAQLGIWYSVELKGIDWDSQRFDIWVDGSLQVENVPFVDDLVNLTLIQAYDCPLDGPMGSMYIDDMILRSHAHELTGRVTLDGVGMADVEVFLLDERGPRYDCTDANGYYSFTDVRTVLVVATGPSVNAPRCGNEMFVDSDGAPLLIEVAAFFPDGWNLTGGETQDFALTQLPTEHRGLYHQLRAALGSCYGGNSSEAWENLDGFGARVDRALEKGKISEETAGLYHRYAFDFAGPEVDFGVAGIVCPMA